MSSISEYMPEDFAQTYAFQDKVTKPKTGEEKTMDQNKAVAKEAAKAVLDNSPDQIQEKTEKKIYTAKVKPGEDP